MSDESRDIERLIADAIEDARDGELDEMRLAEIHDLLAASPEARRAYLEYNQLSRMLSAEQLPPVASDGAVAASGGVRRDPEAASNRFLSLAGWGIAAALLIGIVIASSGNNTGDQDSIQPHVAEQVVAEPPTAVLTRAIDIEWEHERRFQAELGQPVSERVLRVKSGIAEITFSSGATVTVEGSAKLRIDSPMSCFSMWGRFAANCPPSAHGFTVRFKGGKVVDLGTEFALDSEREGKTAVHVLSGEVIVAATDDEENVLQEISVKGNSAVELNPDTGGIGVIEYDGEAFNNLQRESLIRSQPIKLQFDLGHRAGLYKGVNAPAHAAGDMFAHEDVWTQIVGDQAGAFVMADGNLCPHPIRVDYGHGDGIIDWNATPVDPSGSVYSKAEPFFNTALCQDHRPWHFDLGMRVAGLPAGTYRVYALCRSIRRPTAAYDVSFGVNLDRQLDKPLAMPPMNDLGGAKWQDGLTCAI
ncbi:MAG: hypothetical protein ABGX07_17370, partial [Pirellulaceae bacterium]